MNLTQRSAALSKKYRCITQAVSIMVQFVIKLQESKGFVYDWGWKPSFLSTLLETRSSKCPLLLCLGLELLKCLFLFLLLLKVNLIHLVILFLFDLDLLQRLRLSTLLGRHG
uniref:Uncharacterized protein n=1 Tax=Rhizophora mucronata TaxID=61149 RepID=A0A2P2KC18_RHIMU